MGKDLTRRALSTSEVPSAWAILQRFSLWIGGVDAIVLPMLFRALRAALGSSLPLEQRSKP